MTASVTASYAFVPLGPDIILFLSFPPVDKISKMIFSAKALVLSRLTSLDLDSGDLFLGFLFFSHYTTYMQQYELRTASPTVASGPIDFSSSFFLLIIKKCDSGSCFLTTFFVIELIADKVLKFLNENSVSVIRYSLGFAGKYY